jgi:hypothetical protein
MVKTVAGVFGAVFVLVAILGFVAGGMSMETDPATAPKVLGLFPVNAVHNGVHLGFGLWGLLAARSWAGARNYCRIGGVLYLLLAVFGYFVPNGLGLVPLGGHDIWLHAVLGIVLAGVGFAAKDEPVVGNRVTA